MIKKASEGMYFTKKQRENQEPLMFKVVIFNDTENPNDWVEIPIAEGDAIVARWRAEQERKMREQAVMDGLKDA